MNIILVSGRLAKARTITLGPKHIAVATAGVLFAVLLTSGLLNFAMLRYAAELPFLKSQVRSIQQSQLVENESYMRDNLNAMAQRLGQMQAQLLRLDTLGERLAKLAGFKPQDFQFNEAPGRGGFQLFPRIKGIPELFDGTMMFFDFGNFDGLKDLIDYYVEHDQGREALRTMCHEHVKKHHTYVQRWETILETI